MTTYAIGDRVKVRLGSSKSVEATLASYEEDIKNDRPGYVLSDCSDGLDHWCYEAQIIGLASKR
jgi:hypothetical protein